MYPICKNGSACISIGLVWGCWNVKLVFPAAEVELHSIALRLNPSPSSWKWSIEVGINKEISVNKLINWN